MNDIENAVLDEIGRTVVDVPMREQRSLATVTAEIRTLQDAARRVVLGYSVEIGRRLVEAKSMVGHGEWGSYLREELGFSQSTANNHMRLFEAYGASQMTLDGAAVNSQALANLSYTQALELLALPSEEEREEFVRGHDMDQLSTRELHAEIARLREEKAAVEADAREINAKKRQAEARAEELEARAESLTRDAVALMGKKQQAEDRAEELAGRLPALQREKEAAEAAQKAAEADKKLLAKEKDRAEKEAKAAKKELDEARKNPQVPQEVLDRLKREAEEAAKKAADAARVAAVQAAKEEMARDARRYKEELEAAQKALKLAAPEMAAFRVRFEAAQEALNKAVDAIWSLPSNKVDGGVRAIRALLEQTGKRLDEERWEKTMPE